MRLVVDNQGGYFKSSDAIRPRRGKKIEQDSHRS